MACYDDASFISEYLQHAVVACDDLAEFIFQVPMGADEEGYACELSTPGEEKERTITADLDCTINSNKRLRPSVNRGRRTARERQLGVNILEDYCNREPASSIATVVPDERETYYTNTSNYSFDLSSPSPRLSSFKHKAGRMSRMMSRDLSSVRPGDAVINASTHLVARAAERNKTVTWTDLDLIDGDRARDLFRPKDVPVKEKEKERQESKGAEAAAPVKSRKESPFIKATECAANGPKNPFMGFSKFATPKPFVSGRSVRNEFKVYVHLEHNLEDVDMLTVDTMQVRFVPSAKIYDVMGLVLWKYQSEAHSGSKKNSNTPLPYNSVDCYELLGLMDEEDEPDMDAFTVDANSEATKYEHALYILKPKDERDIPTQSDSAINIDIHMIGISITKNMQVSDRNVPLKFIFDEGLKMFSNGRPNYGPKYVLVPYNDEPRKELDLDKSLSDYQYRSFLLRRTNCAPTTATTVANANLIYSEELMKFECVLVNSSTLRKKDNTVVLTCSNAFIELDHASTHNSFSNDKVKLTHLASWEPDQVVDFEIISSEYLIKLLVYLKPSNVHVKMSPGLLQETDLVHTNFRSICLKFHNGEDKSLRDFAEFVFRDKYVEISAYQKLWDFQSEQNKMKILNRQLPF